MGNEYDYTIIRLNMILYINIETVYNKAIQLKNSNLKKKWKILKIKSFQN